MSGRILPLSKMHRMNDVDINSVRLWPLTPALALLPAPTLLRTSAPQRVYLPIDTPPSRLGIMYYSAL